MSRSLKQVSLLWRLGNFCPVSSLVGEGSLSSGHRIMGLNSSRTISSANLSSPHAKFVQKSVAENCVVIFSKTTCPYCTQVKQLFHDINVPYTAIELNQRSDGHELQGVLHQMTNARTVPRVFINGDCVGGATETKQLKTSGQLTELLQKCDIAE